MIRQAHNYLVGAISASAMIGAAVVVFVVLVSAQAFSDWPLTGLGGAGTERASTAVGKDSAARDPAPGAPRRLPTALPQRGSVSRPAGAQKNVAGGGADGVAQPALGGANSGSTPGAGTGTRSGPASSPGESAAQQNPSPPRSVAATGVGGATPNSGSGSVGSVVGGAGNGEQPSGALTTAITNTVSGVDEKAGGALVESGATGVTEKVVSGVAGPESAAGGALDKTVEAVGGLLQPHH